MTASTFLLLNLALAFYLIGAIWAHEVDIFRNWQVLDRENFRRLQAVHWRKLPYWIFMPLAVAFAGSVALIWYHPVASPLWAIWGNLGCQLLSHALTATMWGPWQARLSQDPKGAQGIYLHRILKTHWIRTLLINAYALILLAWAIIVLA
ncbi:MAG: hypothetical protein KGI78_02375 [Patescibacteria group bacterium]|nr:hypothetical protein [Patescibacteria group bacterium]MDE1945143.1 hypothetical protein [Patescibacteria group bacterium]MDE2057678.1 hypothetical protein [Patescibacteria group bacterium]